MNAERIRTLLAAGLSAFVCAVAHAAPVTHAKGDEDDEAPMAGEGDLDSVEEGGRNERCTTGEFIFAADGQIEMVACKRSQSELLFLTTDGGQRVLLPFIAPNFLFFIQKAATGPLMCQAKRDGGDELAKCYPLQPVVRNEGDKAVVVPTMKGRFLTGKAYSMYPSEDQNSPSRHGR